MPFAEHHDRQVSRVSDETTRHCEELSFQQVTMDTLLMDSSPQSNRGGQLFCAAVAAFCTYFCMYAFRKPVTAGTFDGMQIAGFELKKVLVVSQLVGYMLSKFIGIKVVSEMRSENRPVAILGLILFAEAALLGFALAPLPLKPWMLFLNGLPLGMVFGLVLAYLEGRKQTEALSAVLCASFIMSSGFVKSVGRWLIQEYGISEFQMPVLTGLIFLPPLFFSVRILQRTPPPDDHDRELRNERRVMSHADRQRFLSAYWPGLTLMVLVYVALTVVRTVRDDFAVEIWRDMGIDQAPSVFAMSESVVALCVTAFSGAAIWIAHNFAAIRFTVVMMCLSFAVSAGSVVMQSAGLISPFVFMVVCGVSLYIPYVAFHTTLFERLISVSLHPGNLGFLMYVADATGYLGYTFVMILRILFDAPDAVLPFFRTTLCFVAAASALALLAAVAYFRRVIPAGVDAKPDSTVPGEHLPPAS